VLDKKLTGSAGEHMVCGVLAQFNWAAALTREGVARTDVLAVNAETSRTVSLQVKNYVGQDWFAGQLVRRYGARSRVGERMVRARQARRTGACEL
jgi:hypothetical protein